MAPPRVPGVEVAQLFGQYCRLKLVEAAVDAFGLVIVPALFSVVAQLRQFAGENVAIGYDGTGVTKRPEVLAGIEAEAAGVANRTEFSSLVSCAVGLGSVLDNRDAASPGYLNYGIQIGGLAVEVDRNYRASAPPNRSLKR